MTDSQIRRRSLAKGAAWAAPIAVASMAAPAYAASPSPLTVSSGICMIGYGDGTTNAQKHDVYLSVSPSSGDTIPKGTKVTWTFLLSNGTAPLPNHDDTKDNWGLTVSPAAGTATTSFTVTFTAKTDVPASDVNCQLKLAWDGSSDQASARIAPKSTVEISTTATTAAGSTTSGLKYTVARRHGTTINDTNRTPHIYTDKIGRQACYPRIWWTNLGNSSNYFRDNMTCYGAAATDCKKPDDLTTTGNNSMITTQRC